MIPLAGSVLVDEEGIGDPMLIATEYAYGYVHLTPDERGPVGRLMGQRVWHRGIYITQAGFDLEPWQLHTRLGCTIKKMVEGLPLLSLALDPCVMAGYEGGCECVECTTPWKLHRVLKGVLSYE